MNTGLPPASVAELIGASTHRLYRAEREGLIPAATRTTGGHRRWSLSDLEEIRAVLGPRRPGDVGKLVSK